MISMMALNMVVIPIRGISGYDCCENKDDK